MIGSNLEASRPSRPRRPPAAAHTPRVRDTAAGRGVLDRTRTQPVGSVLVLSSSLVATRLRRERCLLFAVGSEQIPLIPQRAGTPLAATPEAGCAAQALYRCRRRGFDSRPGRGWRAGGGWVGPATPRRHNSWPRKVTTASSGSTRRLGGPWAGRCCGGGDWRHCAGDVTPHPRAHACPGRCGVGPAQPAPPAQPLTQAASAPPLEGARVWAGRRGAQVPGVHLSSRWSSRWSSRSWISAPL